MSTTVQMYLSKTEKRLISAMVELDYGDIYPDIKVPETESCDIATQVTIAQKKFVETIRAGARYIKSIKVHQKDPMFATANAVVMGFQAEKLYKFN